MNTFKEKKLSDLYTISSGLSKSADQFGFGEPFVSFSDVFWNYFLPNELSQLVNSNSKEQFSCSVKEGDVFLTRTSEKIEELGMSSVALKDYPRATFNGFTKRLRPISSEEIHPKFIGYYLRSPYFRAEITAYSTLTTRASLNNEIIERLRVNIPDLITQKKIASILSTYDDLIENNNQRIKLLEEMAEEIYKEWFVRLRFPGYQGSKFFDKKGKEVAHGTAGALPEGWERKRVDEVFITSSGGTPFRKNEIFYTDGTVNWVKTKELNGSFIFATEEKITEAGLKKSSAKLFPPNTILLGMYGVTLGQLGILAQESATNQACCAFLPKEDSYYSYPYVLIYLKYEYSNFMNKSMGAAQQNISQEIIKGTFYLEPNDQVLKDFERHALPMFEEIKVLMSKNQILQETRDLLLPRLISGKLSVENLKLDPLENEFVS